MIIAEVSDNGVGMNTKLIDEMNEAFSNSKNIGKGYGLFNVDQRIKLVFGDDYGLKIEGAPGVGTTVKISIPVMDKADVIGRVLMRSKYFAESGEK